MAVASHIWRGLQGILLLVLEGIRWTVGNGHWTLFWLNRWMGDRPLAEVCNIVPLDWLIAQHVSNLWSRDGG